jgi:hypothetical protein
VLMFPYSVGKSGEAAHSFSSMGNNSTKNGRMWVG